MFYACKNLLIEFKILQSFNVPQNVLIKSTKLGYTLTKESDKKWQ